MTAPAASTRHSGLCGCQPEPSLPDGLSPHGLRKATCRMLAEAGCTPHQIMAISGHKTLSEVTRYTVAVDRDGLAEGAMALLGKIKERK